MDQEKIGKFIKEVRIKNGLSQEKFGEKYGVTYQAVSKWETGKNLPDISILKNICDDYNKDINELLDVNKKNNNKKIIIIFLIIIALIIILIIFLLFRHSNNSFEFKTIKTTCDNFELSGSIAYDNTKTSIYISDITYCGNDDLKKYKNIECTFYEVDGDTKRKIDSYSEVNTDITLEKFLSKVKFNVDHYSKSCKMYKENALVLEIKATDKNNQVTFYNIPLALEENCKS